MKMNNQLKVSDITTKVSKGYKSRLIVDLEDLHINSAIRWATMNSKTTKEEFKPLS